MTVWRGPCAEANPLLDPQSLLDRCAAEFEQAADRHGLVDCLSWRSYHNFGVARTRLGAPYAQGKVPPAGSCHRPAAALIALPSSRSHTSDHTHAADLALQALKPIREFGYSWGEARCLTLFGGGYHGLGRHRDAVEALTQALPVYQRYGARQAEAGFLLKLGYAHQALGHHHQATQYQQRSLSIARELCMKKLEAAGVPNASETPRGYQRSSAPVSRSWSATLGAGTPGEARGSRRPDGGTPP